MDGRIENPELATFKVFAFDSNVEVKRKRTKTGAFIFLLNREFSGGIVLYNFKNSLVTLTSKPKFVKSSVKRK